MLFSLSSVDSYAYGQGLVPQSELCQSSRTFLYGLALLTLPMLYVLPFRHS